VDVFQVQEVSQAFQVFLGYRETRERKEIVGCLVFLGSLMVIYHNIPYTTKITATRVPTA